MWVGFFFFNDTATTEIYTLSLHDALPIFGVGVGEYFAYAVFNWLSPFTTLFFAALNIKIRQLTTKSVEPVVV